MKLIIPVRGPHPAAQQVHPLLNEEVFTEREFSITSSFEHSGVGCFGGNIRELVLV